jgi:hypothetical protein
MKMNFSGRLIIMKANEKDVDMSSHINYLMIYNSSLAKSVLKLVKEVLKSDKKFESKYDWIKIKCNDALVYLQVKDLNYT